MKNNKGFSLVELIVVIAIMAILVGVAVPVYSSYVEKARMASDRQLVDEMVHAFNLYCHSNVDDMTSGYVVITTDGTIAGGCGEEAMKSAFGDEWADNKLSFGQWTGASGMLKVLSGYELSDLNLIKNSSYLTQSNTESLMSAVDAMTGIASGVIDMSNKDKTKENLTTVLGSDNAAPIIETLEELDLLKDPVAISNMLVNSMADSLDDNEALQVIVNNYAAAYAYAQTPNGNNVALTKMQENLQNVTLGSLTDPDEAFDMLFSGFDGSEGGFDAYMTEANVNGTLKDDQDALVAMLGAVKEISGNFQDKNSLTNEDLYLSDDVMVQVNDYVNAVEALAGLSQQELTALKGLVGEGGQYDNAIVVFLSETGVVSVYPGNVQDS